MSVSLWAYTPDKCDGDICVGDCDLCGKAEEEEDRPTRRGRWEWAEGHEGITCSVCGKRCNGPRIWWKHRYNVPFPAYCENCGARMEAEE